MHVFAHKQIIKGHLWILLPLKQLQKLTLCCLPILYSPNEDTGERKPSVSHKRRECWEVFWWWVMETIDPGAHMTYKAPKHRTQVRHLKFRKRKQKTGLVDTRKTYGRCEVLVSEAFADWNLQTFQKELCGLRSCTGQHWDALSKDSRRTKAHTLMLHLRFRTFYKPLGAPLQPLIVSSCKTDSTW